MADSWPLPRCRGRSARSRTVRSLPPTRRASRVRWRPPRPARSHDRRGRPARRRGRDGPPSPVAPPRWTRRTGRPRCPRWGACPPHGE